MTDTKYNGWTNYETWRVNLELFDGWASNGATDGTHTSDMLRDIAEEYIEHTSEPGIARDYAMAFISNVNWHEIAKHINDDMEEMNQHDEIQGNHDQAQKLGLG